MSSTRRVKVWKVSKESKAGIEISENMAVLAGNRANFVAAHQGGVTMMGKSINLGVQSENIRKGGLFITMNDFVQMIPTTLVTPTPNQIPFPPFGLASGILSDLPFFIAMLATGVIAATVVKNI